MAFAMYIQKENKISNGCCGERIIDMHPFEGIL